MNAMETKPTYCRICEAACGLLADVEGSRVVRLRPDPKHVVSRGFVCAKGTRFAEIHHASDRVDHPLMRAPGGFTRVSWDRALEDIGRRLRDIRKTYGPHAIATYVGNPMAFSYAGTLASHALSKAIGSRNHFSAASLDCSNKFAVSRRMFGRAASHPVPDFERARFALLLGTNPMVSQSSFVHAPRIVERLKGIEKRGGSVYVVDPRRTETVKAVGTHVPIVPNTDAAFLLSLLHVIFTEGLQDDEALERHADGRVELERAVAPFSPERVASLTSIPPEQIRSIARGFAGAAASSCHLSTGVNQGRYGTIAYAAKIALELATGNLDRPGGALMVRGPFDLADLVRKIGVDDDDGTRSRIGGFAPLLGELPTSILPDEILTPGKDQIRALLVFAGNPLLSAPDEARLREAMKQLDLVVSVDLFLNDTGASADYVLPATDWLERHDYPLAQTQLQPQPYVQLSEAVVEPKHERRHDWQIMLDLAKAMKRPLWGRRWVDALIRAGIAAGGPRAFLLPLLIPALGLRPGQMLAEHPHGMRLHRERAGDFLAERIATASGRVQLFDPQVYGRLDALRHEMEASGGSGPRPLRLITKREKLGHNSWMHSNPKLSTKEQRAWIHPEDASRWNLETGDRVRLSSTSGSIELPVELSEELSPGAIAVSHGYGHVPDSGWVHAKGRGGVNVNILAGSGPHAIDELSGMCQFVGIELHLEPLAKTEASVDDRAHATAE